VLRLFDRSVKQFLRILGFGFSSLFWAIEMRRPTSILSSSAVIAGSCMTKLVPIAHLKGACLLRISFSKASGRVTGGTTL
jgi:hypothetical protein